MMRSAMLRIRPELLFSLLISVILTLFFYIDEAKYCFAGILEFANLFFLGVYILIFFGLQRLIQIGLISLGLTRNISILVQSKVSAIVCIYVFSKLSVSTCSEISLSSAFLVVFTKSQ